MIEKIQTYFETLERLSTEELDRSIAKLVRAENRSTALIIAHLAEMSRRRGALEQGYKNLFDYAVRRLNLSEGSVALRLQVANVSRRYPQILAALAENRVSLTVAGLLAPHLNEENVDELIAECSGMSKREAEERLVALRPKPVFRPSIRRTPSPPLEVQAAPLSPPVVKDPMPTPRPMPTSPTLLQPATPTSFNFRFSAGKDFKDKLERLAEVLGLENPLHQMAEVLERAVDIALDKKDLKRRFERRRKSRPDEILIRETPAASRYIPSEVRERVHARADHQCEFRGPDGTRCGARAGLQVEHERPFALHRSHEERFLKVYCRSHNRLSAERFFGVEFIQRKIAAARRR